MVKNNSLLQQIKKISVVRTDKENYTKEDLEVALAWLNDEIRDVQIAKVVKTSKGNRVGVPNYCAAALKQGVASGLVEIRLR